MSKAPSSVLRLIIVLINAFTKKSAFHNFSFLTRLYRPDVNLITANVHGPVSIKKIGFYMINISVSSHVSKYARCPLLFGVLLHDQKNGISSTWTDRENPAM
jgi:hypothetical protein